MISVILPSYNSESTIEKCLSSILQQSYQGDYEIILVDSSIDRTPQIVTSHFPEVKLIHLPEKTDPGTARNIGMKEAKGDIVAFIDSDCIAADDWLANIVEAHNSSYNIVGGVVHNGNNKNSLVAWAGYIAEFREFIPEQPKQEVVSIPTCNISYKSVIFEKFGFFQGKYYPQEDLVFNYNLSRNGEKILLDPAIGVYHHHRTRFVDFLAHQKSIGCITSKVLKVIPLNGSFIARNPLVAPFIIPFLPIIKFIRTLLIFLKYQPGVLRKHFFAWVLFAFGLLFWAAGFGCGVYQKSID